MRKVSILSHLLAFSPTFAQSAAKPVKTNEDVSDSNPGVLEIIATLKTLQSATVLLLSKTATHVDKLVENGGKRLPEPEPKTAREKAEKTLRDSTRHGNRHTRRGEQPVIDEDDGEDLSDLDGPSDDKWYKQQKKWEADSKKPSIGPQIREFASNWLALFGWNTGLTGLAKDFVFQYFKRDWFHDSNGPLLDAIKNVIRVLAKRDDDQMLLEAVQLLVTRGTKLFSRDGALKQLFEDLKVITNDSRWYDALTSVSKEDLGVFSKLLKFFTTDLKHQKPAFSEQELNELDMDEL